MSKAKDAVACALIDSLGGPAELSRKTGFTVQRINNWKVRGIPSSAKIKFPDLFWHCASGSKSKGAKRPSSKD